MTSVITYQLAYLTAEQYELCDECVERGDHDRGTLGAIQHGRHEGGCDGKHHCYMPEQTRRALRHVHGRGTY